MSKRSIVFAVALLTLGIGIGISSLRPTFYSSRPTIGLDARGSANGSNAEKKRTYRFLMRASGRAGRYEACFGGFSSSDDMRFSSTNIYFDSPKQAQRELQRRLKKAREIVSREPVRDEKSRVVGEQVLVTFPPYKKGSAASSELITVKGSDFISIASSTLGNMNEYKKDHRR